MGRRVDDEELARLITEAYEAGERSYTNFTYVLRGQGRSLSEQRVRRFWAEIVAEMMNGAQAQPIGPDEWDWD